MPQRKSIAGATKPLTLPLEFRSKVMTTPSPRPISRKHDGWHSDSEVGQSAEEQPGRLAYAGRVRG